MTNDELLFLKQYLKKEVSLSYLTEKLNKSEYEIMAQISSLKESGENIVDVCKNGDIYIKNYGDNSLDDLSPYYINTEKSNEIKLAFISDTRLGSKYQQLSILNDIYKKAYEYGVTEVFHCGDLSEGVYKGKKTLYNDTLFEYDVFSQTKYIVNNYPYVEGITTNFITGEHDTTHVDETNYDIGKLVSKEREDMKYLGKNRRKIIILDSNNNEKISLLMLHPKGKIPYTVSYKPQQFISALRNEDKTDILIHGHWLQTEMLSMRNITEFSVPSVVATTPEMIDNGLQNTIGAWFVEVILDKNDKKIIPTFIPYYKTYENDYKIAKSLKLERK